MFFFVTYGAHLPNFPKEASADLNTKIFLQRAPSLSFIAGMQHGVLRAGEPHGVPVKFKFMPEFFNLLGYSSHAVGKWHLGYSRKQFLPTARGFKSHYGYWTGKEDYFVHSNMNGVKRIENCPPSFFFHFFFARQSSEML